MIFRLASQSTLVVLVLVLASCGSITHEEATSRPDDRARRSALGSDVVPSVDLESGADPDSSAAVGAQGAVGAGGRLEQASSMQPPAAVSPAPASGAQQPDGADGRPDLVPVEQESDAQPANDQVGPCGPTSDVAIVGHPAVEPLLRRSAELYLAICPQSGRFVVDGGDNAANGFVQACEGTLDLVAYEELPTPADHSACAESGRRLVSVAIAHHGRPEASADEPAMLHVTVALDTAVDGGPDLSSDGSGLSGLTERTDAERFVDYLIGMGYRQVFPQADLPVGVSGLDTDQLEASRATWRSR